MAPTRPVLGAILNSLSYNSLRSNPPASRGSRERALQPGRPEVHESRVGGVQQIGQTEGDEVQLSCGGRRGRRSGEGIRGGYSGDIHLNLFDGRRDTELCLRPFTVWGRFVRIQVLYQLVGGDELFAGQVVFVRRGRCIRVFTPTPTARTIAHRSVEARCEVEPGQSYGGGGYQGLPSHGHEPVSRVPLCPGAGFVPHRDLPAR